MKNKFYFFLTFLLGMLFVFISIFAFAFASYFMYMIVAFLGLLILADSLISFIRVLLGEKKELIQVLIRLGFAIVFLLFPKLPLSVVVILFAVYVCVIGLSQLITYLYYRKEKVSGRLAFLLSSLVMVTIGVIFLLSPAVHAQQLTYIFAIYTLYLGMKYMSRSMRELLSENRKNSLKRRIRVSLPIFMVALLPRIFIEYINGHIETEEEKMKIIKASPLEVFIHASKDGFGAIGHVDICYQNEVIAYGAYDEATTHLFGAIGEGVLFVVDKKKYIAFCRQDDPASHIFSYTLSLDDEQRKCIEKNIAIFKQGLISWNPLYIQNQDANDYASRLHQSTGASFFKFKKGQFKYYFVMTTNCVLLADRIIGKSGIDIVNMNGIITPGTYLSYFEEETKKENSRVIEKHIY